MDTRQKKSGSAGHARTGTASSKRPVTRSGAHTSAPGRQTPAQKSAERRRRTTAAGGTATKTKRPTPEVVYTPARPFSRNRFLLKLLTVVAVVIAIIFGTSIFFKVDTFVVSGTVVVGDIDVTWKEVSAITGITMPSYSVQTSTINYINTSGQAASKTVVTGISRDSTGGLTRTTLKYLGGN